MSLGILYGHLWGCFGNPQGGEFQRPFLGIFSRPLTFFSIFSVFPPSSAVPVPQRPRRAPGPLRTESGSVGCPFWSAAACPPAGGGTPRTPKSADASPQCPSVELCAPLWFHSDLGPRPPLSSVPCPLSPVPCPLPSDLCPLSPVLCPPSSVLCPLSPVSCPLSSVPCPLSSVFCLLSSVFCLLSSVLCPLSSVFCPPLFLVFFRFSRFPPRRFALRSV